MAVPRKIEPSEYYVVFAKLSDSEVACEEKNRLLVRRQVTGLLIPLYRAGIDTYENVPENIGYFAAGEDERVLPLSFNDGPESTLIADAEGPSQRPGQVTRMGEVRTSSAFLGASPDTAAEGTPTFKVTRSSNCMNNKSREYELAAFPDLHSNGLGTIYDPKRVVKVGAKEGRRHLMALGIRTFAQHPLWPLVNIDNMNKEIGQGLMSVALERDPQLAVAGCQLTQIELQDLLKFQSASRRADLAGTRAPPKPSTLKNAGRVLNSIRSIEASIHGSSAEREDMRRQQYGYCYQMGPAHFMLTITPSDIHNGLVAIIASGDAQNPFQSVEDGALRLDLTESEIPGIEEIVQSLAGKDPAACAEYFIDISEYVLTNILGFDRRKHESRPGLLGELEWYGGGIENQGSQLLHGHYVGRVRRWPKWLEDLHEDPPDGDAFVASAGVMQDADASSTRTNPDALQPTQIKALVDFGGIATYPIFELFKTSPGPAAENSSNILCPNCAMCALTVIPLTLFHKSNKVEQQPYVASCSLCALEFTSSALRDACLRTAAATIGGYDAWSEVDKIFVSPCCSFPIPLPNDDACHLEAARKSIVQHIHDAVEDIGLPLCPEYTRYIQTTMLVTVGMARTHEHK